METKIEPNETAIVTPVMLPACPYCADDPARLSIMNQIFPGGMIGTIIFCGNPECRKIISTQIVGRIEQQTANQDSKPQEAVVAGPQLVKSPEAL
jgi:hypothetical protein